LSIREEGKYIWPWYHVSLFSAYGTPAGTGYYTIYSQLLPQISKYVPVSNDIRMRFEGWLVNGVLSNDLYFPVTSNLNLTALYEEQFLVSVNSEHGQIVGSGWYDKGSEVTISVSPTFATEGMLAAIGFDSIMIGWTGGNSWFSSGNRLSFTVHSPVVLNAVWFDSSFALPIAAVCCVVATIALKRRVQGSTSLFCSHCDKKIPRDSVFCPECGEEL